MLSTLPYHQKVKDHFRSQTKTWDFFARPQNKEEQLQLFKTDLLKNTYKFDMATDRHIYDKVDAAKEKLSLQNLNVTVYQAQYTDELNASIVYLHQEAHIVFSGPIVKLLDDDELLAVIAHELTHVKLFAMLDGELETADRIITAIANNNNSEACWYETARLYRLYTEIFCDRGACTVLGKTGPVISSLVKASTGLEKVNPDSYLKQAEEIFATDTSLTASSQLSHPENFIRARALQLWFDEPGTTDTAISTMIEKTATLDQLDIFQQKELAALTRKVIQLLIKPRWFQTALVLSQARQFFPDFNPAEDILLDAQIVELVSRSHHSIKDYLAYLLTDFAWVDPILDDVPCGRAFQIAEDLHLKEQFDAVIKKEMKFSDKKLQQFKQKVLDAYHAVKESKEEQVYND